MEAQLRIAGQRWRNRRSRMGKWTAILVDGLVLGAVEAPTWGQVVCKSADTPFYALVTPDRTLTGLEAGIAVTSRSYTTLWGHLASIALAAESPLLTADLLDSEDFEVWPGSYRLVSVEHVDDGGDIGLLFQNRATRQFVLLHREGVVRIEADASPTLAEAGYRAVGFRDFDGDGSLDLIWENQATQEVAFRWVSGTGVIEDGTDVPMPTAIRTTAAMLRYRDNVELRRSSRLHEAVAL